MINFSESERLCLSHFERFDNLWHLWTLEDHGIIFPENKAFEAGMSIIGICSRLFPDIIIFTFELMSNHLHLTMAGKERRIKLMFNALHYFLRRRSKADLSQWECRLRRIESLADARAVIVYNNRNGFLVNDYESPFSYPWGANRFYFNPEAKARYLANSSPFGFTDRRKACASHKADAISDLRKLDGYVSPMSFCDISAGEQFFRSASHYFNEISRNIESQKMIAQEIGERIFYTDNELFRVVTSICSSKFDTSRPSLLPKDAKVEIAKALHYDYNANNKQIQRLLNLDKMIVDALFP